MDAPVSFFLELLGHEDHHPSDTFAFCINEQAYEIADERVYHALLGLPKKQRIVIILSFWEELSDRQIAEIRLCQQPPEQLYLRQGLLGAYLLPKRIPAGNPNAERLQPKPVSHRSANESSCGDEQLHVGCEQRDL